MKLAEPRLLGDGDTRPRFLFGAVRLTGGQSAGPEHEVAAQSIVEAQVLGRLARQPPGDEADRLVVVTGHSRPGQSTLGEKHDARMAELLPDRQRFRGRLLP